MIQTIDPRRLIIPITGRCNCNCKFCVLGDKKGLLKDLENKAIKKALNKFNKQCSEVSFTGGEPTLRPDILELIRYARQLGYKVTVNSNGRLYAYKDFCKKMAAAGVNVFGISFHSHNERLHDTLVRVNGSFKQVVSGIKNLVSLGQYVKPNIVINKYNFRALPQIAKLLCKFGVKSCQFIFERKPLLAPDEKNHSDFDKAKLKDMLRALKRAIDIGTEAKVEVQLKFIPYCYIRGYEKHVTRYMFPGRDRVIHPEINNLYFNLGELVRFWKNDVCRDCRYGSLCEGIELSSPFVPKKV